MTSPSGSQSTSTSIRVEAVPMAASSLPTTSQDSGHALGVVVAEEVTTTVEQHSVDQAESARVEEDVTVAQNPAASKAGVAAAYDTTLVMASAPLPSSLDVVVFAGD